MKKKAIVVLANLCRLVLGAVFVFSGYVKAIDPIGTQYKIQDYLEALGLQGWAADWMTLGASVVLSALEFTLGILVLFAVRRRLVSKAVFVVMLFMTAVTVWLAVADPIQDCGCFGDAVKLTNMQTLGKNVALLAMAAVLMRWPLAVIRSLSNSTQWIVFYYTLFFILASSFVSLYKLPLFDFRPYRVGTDIKKGMEIPEGAKQPQFETTFILQKDGVKREFTLDDYPDSTWEFVDSKTVQTEAGYVPPIHDFSITLNATGEDITEQVLSREGYTFLLISPHLENADDSNFGDIDQLNEYAQAHGIPFYCLTASTGEGIQRWVDLTGAEYAFCTTDATTLETVIRSNPGLVLIKGGVVYQKWSHNALPKAEELTKPLAQLPIGQQAKPETGRKVLNIFLLFLLPLIALSLADRAWAWTKWLRLNRKKQTIQTQRQP